MLVGAAAAEQQPLAPRSVDQAPPLHAQPRVWQKHRTGFRVGVEPYIHCLLPLSLDHERHIVGSWCEGYCCLTRPVWLRQGTCPMPTAAHRHTAHRHSTKSSAHNIAGTQLAGMKSVKGRSHSGGNLQVQTSCLHAAHNSSLRLQGDKTVWQQRLRQITQPAHPARKQRHSHLIARGESNMGGDSMLRYVLRSTSTPCANCRRPLALRVGALNTGVPCTAAPTHMYCVCMYSTL